MGIKRDFLLRSLLFYSYLTATRMEDVENIENIDSITTIYGT